MNQECGLSKNSIFPILEDPLIEATLPIIGPPSIPTMENPIDRTIRLITVAAGVVSLLVYLVFHFV
jgi:hypothetical protein